MTMIEYEDAFDQKALLFVEDEGDFFTLSVSDEYDSVAIRLTRDDLRDLVADLKEMLT